jgi:hypothetical protein
MTTEYDTQWNATNATRHFVIGDEFNGFLIESRADVTIAYQLGRFEDVGAWITVGTALLLLVIRVVWPRPRRLQVRVPAEIVIPVFSRILFAGGAVWMALAWLLQVARWFGLPYPLSGLSSTTDLGTAEKGVTGALMVALGCIAAGVAGALSATVVSGRRHRRRAEGDDDR